MKYIFTILIGLMLLVSCQNDTKQNKKEQNISATTKTVAVPQSLNKLYTPNSGVLRGVDFSNSKNQILNAEKSATLRENGANVLKYSVDFNDTDYSDIEYLFKNGNLHKIQVDIFTKDDASSTLLYNEIKNFFNSKYKARKSIWESTDNEKVYTVFAKQVKNGVYIVYELI